MTAASWDDRYSGRDLVWSAEPNLWVVLHTAHLEPGTALDVACGEGRNTVWLARRGWSAVGTDFSPVAVDRARAIAEAAGVTAVFEVADATESAVGQFDLVLLCYLQLPGAQRAMAVRTAAGRVAPGGTLVVIAHHSDNLVSGTGGPQDPGVLYDEEDIASDLAGTGLTIELAEPGLRSVDEEQPPAIDLVVVARRTD